MTTSGIRAEHAAAAAGRGRQDREGPGPAPRAAHGWLPTWRAYKAAIALVLVFVLIYTVLGLIGPYLMGVAIDRFISTRQARRAGAHRRC